MKTRYLTAFAALALGVLPCVGEDVATSADFAYALDTVKDWPRAIKTAADISALRPAVYKKGDTLTTTAPDGTQTTAAKSADGTAALTFGAGGLWTFANDKQKGEASFTVRHSIYGTQGAGTDASPAKLVDADELADLVDAGTAGSGYVFTLNGGDSLFGAMTLPDGFCLERRSDGTWRIVTSENGSLFTCAEISYPLDSEQRGPNRTLDLQASRHVAYSGDDWRRDMSKAAVLTFVPPDGGEPTVFNLTGTGVTEDSFTFDQTGIWIVRLTMADDTVREAAIRVKKGFVVSFR